MKRFINESFLIITGILSGYSSFGQLQAKVIDIKDNPYTPNKGVVTICIINHFANPVFIEKAYFNNDGLLMIRVKEPGMNTETETTEDCPIAFMYYDNKQLNVVSRGAFINPLGVPYRFLKQNEEFNEKIFSFNNRIESKQIRGKSYFKIEPEKEDTVKFVFDSDFWGYEKIKGLSSDMRANTNIHIGFNPKILGKDIPKNYWIKTDTSALLNRYFFKKMQRE